MRAMALSCCALVVLGCVDDAGPMLSEVGTSTSTSSDTGEDTEGEDETSTSNGPDMGSTGDQDNVWCTVSRNTGAPSDAERIEVGAEYPALVAGYDNGNDNGEPVMLYPPEGGAWGAGIALDVPGVRARYVGDVDGDGLEDLMAYASGVFWYRALGGGVFESPSQACAGGIGTSAWGDMDDDGIPDLVASSGGRVQVLEGIGDGSTGELLDEVNTSGFGADSLPLLSENTAYILQHGDFGPNTLIIGRRFEGSEWTWVQDKAGYNAIGIGTLDTDEDGDPEFFYMGDDGLKRVWSDGSSVQEEQIFDEFNRYVIGKHSSGVYWVLSYDGVATLYEFVAGEGAVQTLGVFEIPYVWQAMANDYGGEELEFPNNAGDQLELRTFVPCEDA